MLASLKSLEPNPNISIKKEVKVGGICILDTDNYEWKIREPLSDNTTCKKLTYDPKKIGTLTI